MKKILFSLLLVATYMLTSCTANEDVKEIATVKNNPSANTNISKDAKVTIALTFINDYTKTFITNSELNDINNWVNANKNTSQNFRAAYNKILANANKQDPEYGLGADPILDAQDNPSEGFELESYDEQTNYLTVKGKDWPDFKLTMKMVLENGKWVVDGSGIVNIAENEQAER